MTIELSRVLGKFMFASLSHYCHLYSPLVITSSPPGIAGTTYCAQRNRRFWDRRWRMWPGGPLTVFGAWYWLCVWSAVQGSGAVRWVGSFTWMCIPLILFPFSPFSYSHLMFLILFRNSLLLSDYENIISFTVHVTTLPFVLQYQNSGPFIDHIKDKLRSINPYWNLLLFCHLSVFSFPPHPFQTPFFLSYHLYDLQILYHWLNSWILNALSGRMKV